MSDWNKVLEEKGLTEDQLFNEHGLSQQFNRSDFSKVNIQPKSLITNYSNSSLRSKFRSKRNDIFPIRNGKGACRLANNNYIRELKTNSKENSININSQVPPIVLQNERDYLNKALNSQVMNLALGEKEDVVLYRGLEGKRYISSKSDSKILYDNFEIPILDNIQFEIDLGLETNDSIYAIEAKRGAGLSTEVSLLQAFYPVIFLNGLGVEKKIKVKFIVFRKIDEAFEIQIFNVNYDENNPYELNNYSIGDSKKIVVNF